MNKIDKKIYELIIECEMLKKRVVSHKKKNVIEWFIKKLKGVLAGT